MWSILDISMKRILNIVVVINIESLLNCTLYIFCSCLIAKIYLPDKLLAASEIIWINSPMLFKWMFHVNFLHSWSCFLITLEERRKNKYLYKTFLFPMESYRNLKDIEIKKVTLTLLTNMMQLWNAFNRRIMISKIFVSFPLLQAL